MLVPLKDRARGRWASLLPMIGVDSRFLDGRKNGPCPMCGGKTRFRFDDKEGRGTWICNHCGAGDGPDLAMRVLRIDFRELAEQLEPLTRTPPHPPGPLAPPNLYGWSGPRQFLAPNSENRVTDYKMTG